MQEITKVKLSHYHGRTEELSPCPSYTEKLIKIMILNVNGLKSKLKSPDFEKNSSKV